MSPEGYNTNFRDRVRMSIPSLNRLEAWARLQQALGDMAAATADADVVPFESLITNSDAIRLHALGVSL